MRQFVQCHRQESVHTYTVNGVEVAPQCCGVAHDGCLDPVRNIRTHQEYIEHHTYEHSLQSRCGFGVPDAPIFVYAVSKNASTSMTRSFFEGAGVSTAGTSMSLRKPLLSTSSTTTRFFWARLRATDNADTV